MTKKVYRIWKKNWTGAIKEIAFCSSFKSACNYIEAQLKDFEEVSGYCPETNHWIRDKNEITFSKSLKGGYHWGEMVNCYMTESYWMETIILEN